MNIRQFCSWTLAVLLGVHLAAAAAAEATSAAGTTPPVPVYKPPLRGAPASRVGGGSRGVESALPRIAVLAPDHTGLTTREQPDLYWYISEPGATRLEITVINDQSIQPLLEKKLEIPTHAGIQRLRLKDLGIRLKPGVEYRWFVGLVSDPQQRSNDVIASGTIERNEPSAALKDVLAKTGKQSLAFAYAEQGYWYDAIAAISDLVAASPKDRHLREQRAALLEQAGLDEPARFDRAQE